MAYIGIDIGATKTEFLLTSTLDLKDFLTPIARYRLPTNKEGTYHDFLERVSQEINQLAKKSAKPEFVGIGIPGVVDPSSEKMMKSSITCVLGQSLGRDLRQRTGLEIKIENDAKCFALAESHLGAGKNYSKVLGIIMGTGVAGGFIVDGQLYRGRHGMAGEFGHWVLHPLGVKCYCGNKGCMETLISGKALERLYYERTGRSLGVPEIYERLKQDEANAIEVFQIYLDNFALSIGNLVNFFDPDVVVLGGGASNIDLLYDPARASILPYIFSDYWDTPLKKNLLGDSSGIFGACFL